MVIRGLAGERELDMTEFHRGPYRTAVGDDEMLVEIRVPLSHRSGSAYEKVDRRVGDWAVAAAGAALTVRRRNGHQRRYRARRCRRRRPCREAEVELLGGPPSRQRHRGGRPAAAAAVDPVSDQRGSAEYKRHVAGVLTVRALQRAAARATGAGECR